MPRVMCLRIVPRLSPVRRAIAGTLIPCWRSSRITISSPNRTTSDLPRTLGGKVITCRALHPRRRSRSPRSNLQRIEVLDFQSPDLERIHPAMTSVLRRTPQSPHTGAPGTLRHPIAPEYVSDARGPPPLHQRHVVQPNKSVTNADDMVRGCGQRPVFLDQVKRCL
jgi:hypothetical protein